MTPDEREQRVSIFLQLVNSFPLNESVDALYKIICKYDTPGHADRDFVYECLIAHYKDLEEYEKCAKLFKLQKSRKRKPKITARGLTPDDLLHLQTLRYEIPDEVIRTVLMKDNVALIRYLMKKKDSASPNKGD